MTRSEEREKIKVVFRWAKLRYFAERDTTIIPRSKANPMSFIADMKILYHMLAKPVRGDSHAQRMESFYGGQAKNYDDFRKRLLRGREELWQQIPKPEGGIWVDMGGGTGANVENFGSEISRLGKIYVVDLSTSLLQIASDRFQQKGWTNVEAVEADATKYCPPEGGADVVTFSYSLTMIPDWFAAIDNAVQHAQTWGSHWGCRFLCRSQISASGFEKTEVVGQNPLATLVRDR